MHHPSSIRLYVCIRAITLIQYIVVENHKKVSFNIASEASYVYILSGQKLIKNAKNGSFCRIFENLKLAVKQSQVSFNRTKIGENAKIEKIKCDILGDFQTLWN